MIANRHASHTLTRSLLMAASLLSGSRLIWLVNKASWSVVTAQVSPSFVHPRNDSFPPSPVNHSQLEARVGLIM